MVDLGLTEYKWGEVRESSIPSCGKHTMYSGTVGSLVEFMEQVVGDEVVKTWQLYYFRTGRAEGQPSGGRGGAGDFDAVLSHSSQFLSAHGAAGVTWGRGDNWW